MFDHLFLLRVVLSAAAIYFDWGYSSCYWGMGGSLLRPFLFSFFIGFSSD